MSEVKETKGQREPVKLRDLRRDVLDPYLDILGMTYEQLKDETINDVIDPSVESNFTILKFYANQLPARANFTDHYGIAIQYLLDQGADLRKTYDEIVRTDNNRGQRQETRKHTILDSFTYFVVPPVSQLMDPDSFPWQMQYLKSGEINGYVANTHYDRTDALSIILPFIIRQASIDLGLDQKARSEIKAGMEASGKSTIPSPILSMIEEYAQTTPHEVIQYLEKSGFSAQTHDLQFWANIYQAATGEQLDLAGIEREQEARAEAQRVKDTKTSADSITGMVRETKENKGLKEIKGLDEAADENKPKPDKNQASP